MKARQPPDTEKWCIGLRHNGQRPQSTEDHDYLIARKKQEMHRFQTYLMLGLAFAVLWLAESLIDPSESARGRPFSQLFFFISSFLFLFSFITLRSARKLLLNIRRIQGDIRGGILEIYEGMAEDLSVSNRAILEWVKLLPAGTPVVMERFRESGLVYRMNGTLFYCPVPLPCAQVARTPDYAAIAAEWVEPLAHERKDLAYINQRAMSQMERTELTRWSMQLILRPLIMSLVLDFWAAFIYWAHGGHVEKIDPFILYLALLLLAGWWSATLFQRISAAWRFYEDLRVGQVMIARMADPEHTSSDGTPILLAPQEFLPISRVLWTKNGHPAPWRTLG